MKLHSIHFKNLNSLAGEWRIDFDAPGLADGLFVLAGPTGAGKSTILDAITLALFGSTARQRSVSNSHNEVMNRLAYDCFSEAEFTGQDGRRYRAKWWQHRIRTRDGRLDYDPPKASLFDIAENRDISPHHLRDIKNLIAAKTGFTFDSFVQTVLLEQGAFDSFLHAAEEDRAALLEKATDTSRFSVFGKRVNERKKEEARKREALQQEVKGLTDALDDCRSSEELENEADGKGRSAQQYADAANRLRAERAWLEEEEKLADEAGQIAQADAALEARRPEAEAARARLAQADAARALRPAETALRGLADNAAAAEATARERAEASRKRAEAVPEAETRMKEATARHEQAQTALGDMLPRIAEARRLDAEAAQARQVLAGAREACAERDRALEQAAQTVRQAMQRRDKAQAKAEAAQATCEKAEADAAALAAGAEAVENGLHARQEAEKAWQETDTVFQAERKPQLDARLKSLHEKHLLATTLKKMEAHRAELRPGVPCPLCGATSHPYADPAASALPTPDGVQQEIDAATRDLRAAEQAVAALRARADAARAAHERLQEDFRKRQDQVREAREKAVGAREAAEAEVRTLDGNLPALRTAEDEARQAAARARDKMDATQKNCAEIDERRRAIPVEDADALEKRLRKEERDATLLKTKAEQAHALALTQRENAAEEAQKAADAHASATRRAEEARADFAAQLERKGFASEAAWRAACLPEGDYAAARAQIDAFASDGARLKGRHDALAQRRADHAAAPGRPAEPREKATVDTELRQAEAAYEEAVAAASHLRDLISRNAEMRQKLTQAEAALAAQKSLLKKWEFLDGLLGGTDGENFQRYAQGQNLRTLLAAASPHLESMSAGDFSFEWDPSSDSLEPFVRDRHCDRPRPVSNLSGGESFLASLALALSFSNFNADRAPIDTLFLDEGFGTLDDTALDRALDVLSALRDTGRQIGLVTHVAQVKERIPAHIDVDKRGDGRSVLSGPGVTAL